MRQTEKYLKGLRRLRELEGKPKGRPKTYENADLYRLLESKKHIWDHKQGEWIEGSKSMFGDDESTGVARLRIMAHPHDVQQAIQYLRGTNFRIVDISEEYPNRRGSGVRVYITCMLGVK